MPVQARAFVARRDVREAMGGLDHEDFEDFHAPIVDVRPGGVTGAP